MQFLIHAKGATLDVHNKAYIVTANSEKEAQDITEKSFENDFDVFSDTIMSTPIYRTKKAILSYVFLLVAILLSFVPWKLDHSPYSIMPDLISCLYSIALYAAFIVRFKGVNRAVASWVDITFSILITLLLSSFIQIILVEKTINFFWISKFTIDTKIILPIAIALSWLGLKFISLICIAGITLISLFNITNLSQAMSGWGILYIICSFMGILLYLSVEPVTVESVLYLKKSISNTINYTKDDFIQVKKANRNLYIPNKSNIEVLQKTNKETSNK